MKKDFYEVLGVRPNAGPDEIELAYKGRRTQYHPDRYGQADAETQAWATSKMQEVNEAYAALKAGKQRSRLNEASNEGATRPAHTQTRKSEGAANLRQALQGWQPTGEPFEKVFVAPHIPVKKLSGALENYGHGLEARDIVALIDDTVFGGAKEGLLITEAQIRFKAIFQPAENWSIESIGEIASRGNRIFINGREVAKLNVPDKDEVEAFFSLFNTYLEGRPSDAEHEAFSTSDADKRTRGVGERLFLDIQQGFYIGLEKAARRDLASAGTMKERAALELAARLLPAARSLEHLARKRGIPLSATQRQFLSSDMLRLELLTFAAAAAGYLLTAEANFDDDQVAELVGPAALVMMVAYIAELEGVGTQKRLRSIANPMAELRESKVFREFQRRWGRYGLLLNGADGNLAREFRRSLAAPCALDRQEVARAVELRTFTEEIIDLVLPEETVAALLHEILEEVEAALVSTLEQA